MQRIPLIFQKKINEICRLTPGRVSNPQPSDTTLLLYPIELPFSAHLFLLKDKWVAHILFKEKNF